MNNVAALSAADGKSKEEEKRALDALCLGMSTLLLKRRLISGCWFWWWWKRRW